MTTTEFPYETVEEIREKILAVMATEYVAAGGQVLDTSEGSYAWIEAHAQALIQHDLQVEVAERLTQGLPHHSTGEILDLWSEVLLGAGNTRLAPTAWYGTVTVTRTGSTSGTLTAGAELVSDDGQRYVTTADITLAGGASGNVLARSTTTGLAATKSIGATLALVAPPAGWSATATVASTTTTSEDRETDTELQQRVFQRLNEMPGGANPAHFRFMARAASGSVADAFVYPIWKGKGTVTVVPVGEAGERILPTGVGSVIEAVAAKIAADLTPIGWTVTVQPPVEMAQDVVLDVEPDGDHEPGWTGTFTVDAVAPDDPPNRVRLTTDPSTTIEAGDLVILQTGTLGAGGWAQYTVEDSVADGGAGYIDVVGALPDWGTLGSTLYPGSTATDEIVAAVRAVFDALGPSRSGNPDIAERWPDPDLEWYPELTHAALIAAVQACDGVRNTAVDIPAADLGNAVSHGVDPVLYTCGAVLVRYV